MGGAASDPDPINVITLRELARDTYGIVERAHAEGQSIFITHHGRFVAILKPVDDKQLVIEALTHMIDEDPEAFGVDGKPMLTIDEVKQRLGLLDGEQS